VYKLKAIFPAVVVKNSTAFFILMFG